MQKCFLLNYNCCVFNCTLFSFFPFILLVINLRVIRTFNFTKLLYSGKLQQFNRINKHTLFNTSPSPSGSKIRRIPVVIIYFAWADHASAPTNHLQIQLSGIWSKFLAGDTLEIFLVILFHCFLFILLTLSDSVDYALHRLIGVPLWHSH